MLFGVLAHFGRDIIDENYFDARIFNVANTIWQQCVCAYMTVDNIEVIRWRCWRFVQLSLSFTESK